MSSRTDGRVFDYIYYTMPGEGTLSLFFRGLICVIPFNTSSPERSSGNLA